MFHAIVGQIAAANELRLSTPYMRTGLPSTHNITLIVCRAKQSVS